jgi:hypothetical protein
VVPFTVASAAWNTPLTLPYRPPDQPFPVESTGAWVDLDGDGVLDPVLPEPTRGLLQAWPSSRGSDEPVRWSFDGDCAIVAMALVGPAGSDLRLGVVRLRPHPDGTLETEVSEYTVDRDTLRPELAWRDPPEPRAGT